MGLENSDIQRISAFYHALGKVLTNEHNSIGAEKYKSAHNVNTKEIWVDTIGYAAIVDDAAVEAGNNDAVTMVGATTSPVRLYPLQNSNYQSWFLDTGTPTVTLTGCIPSDGWVKPLINPSDVPNTAGAPSIGYNFLMYRPNGAAVNYLTTFWDVDYFSGIVKFQPTGTPGDPNSTSNLGFQTTALDSTNTASLNALQTMLDNPQTGGPHAVAFQYTGQFLDDYLENLPDNGGGGSGSDEWQASVNGYLTEIGNNQTINGLTDINDQIQYLKDELELFYIKTDDDITGVSWSNITATDSYYQFDGTTFSGYTLSTADDANRFLLVENDIILDVIEISATGSVSEFPSTTVNKDHIIEYTGTATSGLSYSAWQVTEPRLGMVTTLDNKESEMVRYIGSSWAEYVYELTYKVNSQKDMPALTTTADKDLAIMATVSFEPTGNKSIDVLLNGLQMPRDVYVFASRSQISSTYSVTAQDPGQGVQNFTFTFGTSTFPYIVGDYINIKTTSSNYVRKIVSINPNSPSTGEYQIEYSGSPLTNITDIYLFKQVERSNNVARKGDNLLWIGSSWYELTGTAPKDLISFNYVTRDPGALNA